MIAFDGIVLAGGASRRMQGASKPELLVRGNRLIDVTVAALAGARKIIVVGPKTSGVEDATWTREDPPGGGPVAALAAALLLVSSDLVAVLAVDLPFMTAGAVGQLLAAAPAVAVDDEGRDQPLVAAYQTQALRAALPGQTQGARLSEVLSALSGVRRLRLDGAPPPWWDCDTPAELERAREWHDA